MIPVDVASRLKLAVPDQPAATQPVTPLKNLPDVLSDLVPGQRVMAEIQALLPNGSYRAVVAQRDITLALPFSAKKGDSLELEVVESDGKLTLAVVNSRSGSTPAGNMPESVSTSLSNTGKLIGDLLGGVGDQGRRAAPASLNGNQPLVDDLPGSAPLLAPILKDALSKSGVFYEAHQARWVAGELPTDALRQEPQGKLSSATPNATIDSKNTDPAPTSVATRAESSPQAGTVIPRDLTPIVQQQLDALATQNYAWQGQIWPGQQMQWEITENPENARSTDSEAAGRWQTRLKLTLPMLGGIDTVLRLRPNGEVDISMTTDSKNSESRLRDGSTALRNQMEAAGLNLTQLLVQHGEATG